MQIRERCPAQRDLALRDKSGKGLELVTAALGRLDDGSYGACLRCGNAIPDGRLEARPLAERTVEEERQLRG